MRCNRLRFLHGALHPLRSSLERNIKAFRESLQSLFENPGGLCSKFGAGTSDHEVQIALQTHRRATVGAGGLIGAPLAATTLALCAGDIVTLPM